MNIKRAIKNQRPDLSALCERDCSFVYIGQTKRDLTSRLDEHKRAIKNQRPDLSALCEHYITMDHIISWTEAKILELETDYRKRLSFESWYINAKLHVMSRNDGNSFPAVYSDLLKLQRACLHS